MTATEKRALVIAQAKPAIGRNKYSQNAVKREFVFRPYTDGKYYSDCSSFVRWLYRAAGLYTNIGGNTVGIMNSKLGTEISCKIKNGIPTDVSALRVGDLFLFRGTDKNRASSRYVGHVEIVSAIKDGKVTLMGHGSGNPKTHSMTSYCRTRWLTPVANTKIKNRGLICVKRFIPDDVQIVPVPVNTTLGSRMLERGDYGDDVAELQAGLTKLRFDPKGIDKDFGPATQKAVKRFQKAQKIEVDGVVGPITVGKLRAALKAVEKG